ncbi:MAG TPA: hypothetical protein VGN20_16620 [Mucilaginibacter sp.]|jgi:hypothetical protein
MKYTPALLLALITVVGLSQNKLPVVNATSGKAQIYEQHNVLTNWNISPKIKLDVFSTGKLAQPEVVKFKTDIDSVSFRLRPGQQKDFIVLLNGKDSCLTRIQSPLVKDFSKLPVPIHDTIPFFVNKFNTNFLPVVLNGTDSLLLNFDSGATEICITTDGLKQKVKSQPKLYNTAYDIQIGNQTFKSKIYDIALAGNEVDGLLGWNLFDGMIVELDYDNNRMIVHSEMPKQVLHDAEYDKFKITFIKNKPFIESKISQSGTISKSLFFFDLGYQRTVMLDNDVLTAARFPTDKMKVIKKIIMHGTRGNEIPVITSNLERLIIGKFELKNVPAQVMTQGKPMPGVSVHYLGSDVLKRFNTVLDFQKNAIYLKPNHLYRTEYADQKNSGT